MKALPVFAIHHLAIQLDADEIEKVIAHPESIVPMIKEALKHQPTNGAADAKPAEPEPIDVSLRRRTAQKARERNALKEAVKPSKRKSPPHDRKIPCEHCDRQIAARFMAHHVRRKHAGAGVPAAN